MKISAIITKNGVYLNQSADAELYYDGKLANHSWHKDWCIVSQIPNKVERKVSHENINYRYELIDSQMESDTVKKVLMRDDVATYYDYEWLWNDDIKHLCSLYRLVSDTVNPTMEDQEFEIDIVLELDETLEASGFIYPVNAESNVYDDKNIKISGTDATNQLIDKLRFPPIVMSKKPCSLSSTQFYRIVRKHIQDNINPKYAEITSDYDFCFTVKKKISLTEPEKYTYDKNLSLFGRKKKPKYITAYRKQREIAIFEMTHKAKNYESYTPIDGIVGKNHTDMKKKIDEYLVKLMERINEPLIDCPHCFGVGVIIDRED